MIVNGRLPDTLPSIGPDSGRNPAMATEASQNRSVAAPTGTSPEATAPVAVEQGSASLLRLVAMVRRMLHCEGVALLTYGQQGDPLLHSEPPLSGDLARVLMTNVDALTPDGTVLALDRTHIQFPDGSPVRRAELRRLRSPSGSLAGVLAVLSTGGDVYFPRGGSLLADMGQLLEDHLALMHIGIRDHLTGLYNRRFFDEMAGREWRRARRDQLPVSVLMADVDHFKAYNDSLGHQAGDRVLQQVAQCMSGTFRRAADVLARYGGEEFAAILPKTDPDGGRRAGERLCAAVEALRIPHPDSAGGFLTISVGVASVARDSEVDGDLSSIIRRADEALYAAKRAGRARVVTH